jgi:hypothetical protein
MDWQRLQQRIHDSAGPWSVAIAAVLVVVGLDQGRYWLDRQIEPEEYTARRLGRTGESLTQVLDHMQAMRDLKSRDVARFKNGFSDLARSRKTLFEAGLSLQEERRLLEKQLEIMTTYLTMEPALGRIFLMRGEQPLESYLINYLPPRTFPDPMALVTSATGQLISVPTAPPPLPAVVRIVSKERYAHPERGQSEQINGALQYNPPQVGTSVRSNALGQYVMFTNSKVVLHGPPLNEEDHQKFPHVCLGLDLEAARKLYRGSYIGTKILLKQK